MMKLTKERFSLLFLILLTLSIYTPKYGTLDRMSVQFFLMSLTNSLGLLITPFVFNLDKLKLKKLYSHPLVLSYFTLVCISLVSIIKSINYIESLVRLNQLITFFISLLFLIFLTNQKLIKKKHILWIIISTVIVDISFSLAPLYGLIKNDQQFSYSLISNFVGLAGNRNILAISLLFRLPFLIYFVSCSKNKAIKLSILTLLTLLCFNIYLLSSRAALLGLILLFLLLILIVFLKIKKIDLAKTKKLFTVLIIPIFISFVLFTNSLDSSDQARVESRVASIGSNTDESINSRIRFWRHSLDFIVKNPFLGGGIGNWKIISIEYDAPNIKSYILPFNTHNDFLEFTAETGILGGLVFLSFFIILFLIVLKSISDKNNEFDIVKAFVLLSCLMIYVLDLNLNFPSSRPLNLYLLLMFVAFLNILYINNGQKN